MTTITYKNGVLASDSRAYSGEKEPVGWKKKIFHLDDSSLIGASSCKVGLPEQFRRLVNEFGVEHSFQENLPVQALVIKPNGRVYYFNDGRSFSGPIYADYYAIGSGADYSMAAMHLGLSASEAIEVAIKFDTWSGGKVQTLSIKDHENGSNS